MTDAIDQGRVSPFDQIKHTDEVGRDYWSARDLAAEVEYEEWRNFDAAISKAYESIASSQGLIAAQDHIGGATKMVSTGSGAQRGIADYRLTRHGAYRVLQECDGRKPRIAEAKLYFAARTQEAEFFDGMDRDLQLIVENAKAIQKTRQELRQVQVIQQYQGERQIELEARVSSIEGRSGWYSVMAYAKVKGLPANLQYRKALGKEATRIANLRGITPGKVPDERFGEVNSYPETVLDDALAAMSTLTSP